MFEEKFKIWVSKRLQNGLILLLYHSHTFTMVEESFEIWVTKTLQNSLILLFDVIVLPSPWLKENSEISLPGRLQNGLNLLFYVISHTFTMFEENL